MDNPGYCGDRLDTPPCDINIKTKDESIPPSYGWRSTLSQCLACYVDGMSLIVLGSLSAMMAIIIEYVHHSDSDIPLSIEQISWYGGFLQSYLGRRHGLLLMHMSSIVTWFILYKAYNVGMLYLSAMLSGVSKGFCEAPGLTYVSEITTPKLRGMLVTSNEYNVNIGVMVMFLLSTSITWRTCCLVGIGWSSLSIIFLNFIPESPIWLIAHGRIPEAMKSLQRLRGWVSETEVKKEFEYLCDYVQVSKDNSNTDQENAAKSPQRRCFDTMTSFFRKDTLRPYTFLMVTWVFALHATLLPMRNYFLVILNTLNLPMESKRLSSMESTTALIGGLTSALVIRLFGKRAAAMTSIGSSSLLSILLGLYVIFQFEVNQPWIFVIMYVIHGFTRTCIIATPWILIGEVYPLRTKSVATGITAASLYLSHSITMKIFFGFMLLLSTQAIIILYGILGTMGFLYIWMFMPETEGKTMSEIQELFADDARRSCPHFRTKK